MNYQNIKGNSLFNDNHGSYKSINNMDEKSRQNNVLKDTHHVEISQQNKYLLHNHEKIQKNNSKDGQYCLISNSSAKTEEETILLKQKYLLHKEKSNKFLLNNNLPFIGLSKFNTKPNPLNAKQLLNTSVQNSFKSSKKYDSNNIYNQIFQKNGQVNISNQSIPSKEIFHRGIHHEKFIRKNKISPYQNHNKYFNHELSPTNRSPYKRLKNIVENENHNI